MGTIGAVAGAVQILGTIINNHIEDPQRRMKAIQDAIDGFKKLKEEAINEKDAEELDKALIAFIDAVHAL